MQIFSFWAGYAELNMIIILKLFFKVLFTLFEVCKKYEWSILSLRPFWIAQKSPKTVKNSINFAKIHKISKIFQKNLESFIIWYFLKLFLILLSISQNFSLTQYAFLSVQRVNFWYIGLRNQKKKRLFCYFSNFCRVINFCRRETLLIWNNIYFWWKIWCNKN